MLGFSFTPIEVNSLHDVMLILPAAERHDKGNDDHYDILPDW